MRKWQRMAARLGAGVLAALLAGCAAGGQGAENAPGSAETAAQAETAEAEAGAPVAEPAEPPLRRLQCADEQAYFEIEYIDGEIGRLCVTDFTTGQRRVPCSADGCTHDTADCPAAVPWNNYGGVYVLDGETLLWAGSALYLSGRSGEEFRALCEEFWFDESNLFTDGEAVYCLAYPLDENNTSVCRQLCRVDLASGERQVLADFPDATLVLGGSGRTFLLRNYYTEPLPGQTGGPTRENPGEEAARDVAYDIDSGEARRLGQYPVAQSGHVACASALLDGVYYVFDDDARRVTGLDLASGETVLKSDELPPAPNEGHGQEHISPSRVLNGWLELDVSRYDENGANGEEFSYLVDLASGAVQRKPDLPVQVYRDGTHQPLVCAQLADRLLVTCAVEPYSEATFGTYGTPYTIEGYRLQLGLVAYDDYLNGTADYQLLEAYL